LLPNPAALRPLPTTPAVSGVLETLSFLRDLDFARSRFERYGDVYGTTLLGQRTVFIRGQRAINDLFAQSDALEGWWPESVRKLLGPLSLANRNGADHKARRRVVGQLFASAALKRYSPAIIELVDDLQRELLAEPAPVALVPKLRRFAFSVIASTVLGLGGDDREVLFEDFETWCRGLFSLPFALPGSPYARALQARQRLLRRLGAVLEKAQGAAAAGAPLAAGGLDLLAGGLDEAGLPLGDDDVAEQLLLLLFAGYETTASSLSCLLLSLMQNPLGLAAAGARRPGLAPGPGGGTNRLRRQPRTASRCDAQGWLRRWVASFVAPGSRLCWRMCRFRPIWWCR
jgi:cytochrome P450